MKDEHLDPESLRRLMAEDRVEDRNRLLLHLLSRCPECYAVGGYLLDLYQKGALPLSFGLVDSALARSRAEAPRLWEELAGIPFEEQARSARCEPRYTTWGLCELLCRESREQATEDPARAAELAELAVLISETLVDDEPAEDRWLYQLRGLAWAHLGNARRILGALRKAQEAFSIADQWWEAGEASAGDALGYEPILLSLKASLRIAQRRFPEALEILDRVVEIFLYGAPEHRDSHLAGRAMTKKALAISEMGEPDQAIELLRQARGLVDLGRDPRLALCLEHNLLDNLSRVGRYEEAEALLPEVQALAEQLGRPLDLVRLLWAEGRIAAGLGQQERARAAMEEVRCEFVERGMGYDAALVSLELAVLLVEEGRTAEVRELAREMVAIFESQDIHREALAAIAVFQRAAAAEIVTVELARDIASFLERARHDPALGSERE